MSSTTIKPELTESATLTNRLRLLSYNLQVGIGSRGYRDYLTQSWRHILPDNQREANLYEIARWLGEYDIVALQEVDAGSLRTQYVNQVAYLAREGGFPFWHQQSNRRLGQLAAHSNGLLCRSRAALVVHHKLPGRIPGRGVIEASFGGGEQQLIVLSMHLALSKIARNKQLGYIAELIKGYPYFVLMGDMNCRKDRVAAEFAKSGVTLKMGQYTQPTFPRWNPQHQFDQIWVSDRLRVIRCEVPKFGVSDHLPIAMEIEIPESLAGIRFRAPTKLN